MDIALCFSALRLCNLNFNSRESVVDRAVITDQLELSDCSGILQIGDLPHLCSSETKNCPSPPTITSVHYLLFCALPFLIISRFSSSDIY